jgi:hypothetical protein
MPQKQTMHAQPDHDLFDFVSSQQSVPVQAAPATAQKEQKDEFDLLFM